MRFCWLLLPLEMIIGLNIGKAFEAQSLAPPLFLMVMKLFALLALSAIWAALSPVPKQNYASGIADKAVWLVLVWLIADTIWTATIFFPFKIGTSDASDLYHYVFHHLGYVEFLKPFIADPYPPGNGSLFIIDWLWAVMFYFLVALVFVWSAEFWFRSNLSAFPTKVGTVIALVETVVVVVVCCFAMAKIDASAFCKGLNGGNPQSCGWSAPVAVQLE